MQFTKQHAGGCPWSSRHGKCDSTFRTVSVLPVPGWPGTCTAAPCCEENASFRCERIFSDSVFLQLILAGRCAECCWSTSNSAAVETGCCEACGFALTVFFAAFLTTDPFAHLRGRRFSSASPEVRFERVSGMVREEGQCQLNLLIDRCLSFLHVLISNGRFRWLLSGALCAWYPSPLRIFQILVHKKHRNPFDLSNPKHQTQLWALPCSHWVCQLAGLLDLLAVGHPLFCSALVEFAAASQIRARRCIVLHLPTRCMMQDT